MKKIKGVSDVCVHCKETGMRYSFTDYKPGHECSSDNPKGEMDEPHIGRCHSGYTRIVCVLQHWRSLDTQLRALDVDEKAKHLHKHSF